jgi:hypothetical protein
VIAAQTQPLMESQLIAYGSNTAAEMEIRC